MVFAHRGDSSHAPENTLEAARIGHASGADAWELDVQLTRDGVPVVLHDPTLRRTTNVALSFQGDPRAERGFPLSEFDWDEIRTLDAGGWFLDPRGGPRTALAFGTRSALNPELRRRIESGAVRIPTLQDALELTQELDWLVNIELKYGETPEPGLIAAALAVIDATGTSDRVLISSFNRESVALVARSRPDLATGLLVERWPEHATSDGRETIGADALHPSVEAVRESLPDENPPASGRFRARELASLHRAGIRVHVYTVNDHSSGGLADQLAALGVDGVFTDDPSGLLRHWLSSDHSLRSKAADDGL